MLRIRGYFFISLIIIFSGCAATSPTPFVQKTEPEVELNATEPISDVRPLLPKTNLVKSIEFFKELDATKTQFISMPAYNKINQLNSFFNNWFKYAKDDNTYHTNDYWASFYEMMQSGFVGDCEDFTFGKIQMSELFGIEKKDVFIGYTKKGAHVFPIFCDGEKYWISDSVGRLRTIPEYLRLYPDMQVYSFDEVWTTKDALFLSKRNSKTLDKILGTAASAKIVSEKPKINP